MHMSKRDDILVAAESVFEQNGFYAVPMDRLIQEAAVSPRTLYRYFGSKTELAGSVLRERAHRFVEQLRSARDTSRPVEALLDRLEIWLDTNPATGCLFLRALGEYQNDEISEIVHGYKQSLQELCLDLSGGESVRASSLVLLIEGSTALAPVIGASEAISLAKQLAKSGGLM